MQPDLEVVQVGADRSFKIWSHGYPYPTVRWHFHPEYELHLVTTTSGNRYVGDHIGPFEPGDLVLTGPNLPHNWISQIAPDELVTQRCLVLQFTEALITDELACQHLTLNDLSITEICYEVGFNNVSNLNRQFLATKGLPPSRFRDLYRRGMRLAPAA
jgi:hypothetical protein